MAEVHHFTYGAFNPIAAYLLAFLGSFLGLLCTGRARAARTRGRRNRWLIIAAFSIGGAAIWLMHFTAMLGFDVPASPVRYDVRSPCQPGLAVHHRRRRADGRRPRPAQPGQDRGGRRAHRRSACWPCTTPACAACTSPASCTTDPTLVAASGVIAVVAATVALWFTVSVKGWAPITGAAAVMAIAVCGMHYTGMAAMQVELLAGRRRSGSAASGRCCMIVPITLITAATILAVALSALQAMTEEEFTDGAGTPRRGVHAEHPWSLKQASLMAMRRHPGTGRHRGPCRRARPPRRPQPVDAGR